MEVEGVTEEETLDRANGGRGFAPATPIELAKSPQKT